MTLNQANSYSGATTINSGTLVLGGGGSISNSPTIGVAGGAAFDVTAEADYHLASGHTLAGGGTVLGQADGRQRIDA